MEGKMRKGILGQLNGMCRVVGCEFDVFWECEVCFIKLDFLGRGRG